MIDRAEMEYRRAAFASAGGWLLHWRHGAEAWSVRVFADRHAEHFRSAALSAGVTESRLVDVGMEAYEAAKSEPDEAMAAALSVWRTSR